MCWLVNSRLFCFYLLVVLAIGFCESLASSSCYAQEADDTETVVSLLREDVPQGIMIRSLDEFHEDTTRLFKDLGQPMLTYYLDDIVEEYEQVFHSKKPLSLDLFNLVPIIGYPASEDKLAACLGDRLTGEALDLPEGILEPEGWQVYKLADETNHWRFGEFISVTDGKAIIGISPEEIAEFFQLKPLAPRLEPRTKRLFNESGLTAFSLQTLELSKVLPLQVREFSETEQTFLAQLNEKLKQPVLFMLGMKYHQQMLESRFRTQLSQDQQLEDLFQLQPNGTFDPDLGLTKQGLLAAAAIRMDVAKNSAATRLMPALVLNQTGSQRNFSWLGGSSLNVLTQIVGDSWSDLTTARGAVYRGPEDNGKYCLIGVVDSRDPEVVMQELRRLSVLTETVDPELVASELKEQQAEIARLLKILTGDDLTQVGRAETRLILAGPKYLTQLEEALVDADPKTKHRLQRVIGKVKAEMQVDTDSLDVGGPEFWSRLRPGLELVENQKSIVGFKTHVIKITADPSKGPQQVATANAAMAELFGKQWNEIQVVQIDHHFVFMLGSDAERLKATLENVSHAKGELDDDRKQVDKDEAVHAMQFYADLLEIAKDVNPGRFKEPEAEEESPLATGSLTIEQRSVELELLVPTPSLSTYVRIFIFGGY